MLVITGIFEDERFIPDRPVSIPQKKKVVVTIEEHTEEDSSTEKPVELSLEIDERRKMYTPFCGIWTEKDSSEFKEATKDFEVIEPGEWL